MFSWPINRKRSFSFSLYSSSDDVCFVSENSDDSELSSLSGDDEDNSETNIASACQ